MVKALDGNTPIRKFAFHVRCDSCGKLLEYGLDDMEFQCDNKNAAFVQCPNCGNMQFVSFINVN